MCEQRFGKGYTVIVDQVKLLVQHFWKLIYWFISWIFGNLNKIKRRENDHCFVKSLPKLMFKGFLEDAWTGPQILAHHLLLMLTSDLNDSSKTCPRKESLLHPKLYPGKDIYIYYLSGYLLSHLILNFDL